MLCGRMIVWKSNRHVIQLFYRMLRTSSIFSECFAKAITPLLCLCEFMCLLAGSWRDKCHLRIKCGLLIDYLGVPLSIVV